MGGVQGSKAPGANWANESGGGEVGAVFVEGWGAVVGGDAVLTSQERRLMSIHWPRRCLR